MILKVAKHKLSNILGGIDLSNEKIENLDEKSLVVSKLWWKTTWK